MFNMFFGKKGKVINEIKNQILIMEHLIKETDDYSLIQYFKGHIEAYRTCIKIIKRFDLD